jgi:hypothetical protein
MKMDVSSDFYVDMFLTLIGYLAAVGLGAVIYSLRTRRRRQTAPAAQLQTDGNHESPHPAPVSGPQFLRLGSAGPSVRRSEAATDNAETSKGAAYRDRVDIIRIAREMLKAGADHKRIQQVLPVSEAELALLNLRNN